MIRLIICRNNSYLKFPLFPDKLLCLVHVNTSHFDTDILCNIPDTGLNYHLNILGTPGIEFVIKDLFCKISGSFRNSLLI